MLRTGRNLGEPLADEELLVKQGQGNGMLSPGGEG